MNNIQIIGNIGRDAEIKTTQSGKKLISFSVATTEKIGQEKQTTWFSCTKWLNGTDTEAVANYIKKGGQIFVSGRISARVHEDKAYLEINVNNIELLSGGGTQESTQDTTPQPQAAQPISDDGDLPF